MHKGHSGRGHDLQVLEHILHVVDFVQRIQFAQDYTQVSRQVFLTTCLLACSQCYSRQSSMLQHCPCSHQISSKQCKIVTHLSAGIEDLSISVQPGNPGVVKGGHVCVHIVGHGLHKVCAQEGRKHTQGG